MALVNHPSSSRCRGGTTPSPESLRTRKLQRRRRALGVILVLTLGWGAAAAQQNCINYRDYFHIVGSIAALKQKLQ